jgi:hypothetical protein
MKGKAGTCRIGVVAIMCIVFVLSSVAVAGSAGLKKKEIFMPLAAFTNDVESPENSRKFWYYKESLDTGYYVYALIILPKGAEQIRLLW